MQTLGNVSNFVKPALHVNKTCYVCLTNIHSFVLQTKHFHWSSRYSCLGNCLVWKINMCEKTFTLHGWSQMVVLFKPAFFFLKIQWEFFYIPLGLTKLTKFYWGWLNCGAARIIFKRQCPYKNGPLDFASKNHFSLKSADREGLVPKY